MLRKNFVVAKKPLHSLLTPFILRFKGRIWGIIIGLVNFAISCLQNYCMGEVGCNVI